MMIIKVMSLSLSYVDSNSLHYHQGRSHSVVVGNPEGKLAEWRNVQPGEPGS
jgi:hypothetical protein